MYRNTHMLQLPVCTLIWTILSTILMSLSTEWGKVGGSGGTSILRFSNYQNLSSKNTSVFDHSIQPHSIGYSIHSLALHHLDLYLYIGTLYDLEWWGGFTFLTGYIFILIYFFDYSSDFLSPLG